MVRHQESPIGSSGETPGITERRSFTSFQMVHTHTHKVGRNEVVSHLPSILDVGFGPTH